MATRKHFLLTATIILLLAIVPGRCALAQQTGSAESTTGKQTVSESNARANSKPGAQPGERPSVKPETPVQNAAPAPEIKDANERLPFMAQSERETHEQAPSATGLLLRTFGALLLIVGLIVAAAWGMKRFGGARFGAPKADAPDLAVLNSIALGERRSLAIVRFGNRTLLLGSTPQSVTLLAENEIEKIAPRIQSVADMLNETPSAPFSEELWTATSNLQEPAWKGDEDVQW